MASPTLRAPLDLQTCEAEDLARPDAVQVGVYVLLLDPVSFKPRALSAGCRDLSADPLEAAFARPLAGFWTP